MGRQFFYHLNAYKCTYDAHFRAYILHDDATCQMISYSSLFHSGTVHICTSHIHELYSNFTFCFMHPLAYNYFRGIVQNINIVCLNICTITNKKQCNEHSIFLST